MTQNGDNHLETDQSLCPFKMLTGFPCPGCGITKSLVYLYEGDLYKSFSYHLFGPFAFLFCIVTVVVLSIELVKGNDYFNHFFYNRRLAYGLGFVLVSYHLVRVVNFIFSNNIDDILHQSVWR